MKAFRNNRGQEGAAETNSKFEYLWIYRLGIYTPFEKYRNI